MVRQLAREGMTLIMVTHEMRFAREVGDKLVFMHQGKLVQALKDVEVMNPVIMLDEIDKMGQSFQGDPGSVEGTGPGTEP